MGSIRALALCAIVALVFASCAAASESEMEVGMEVPRPHTTTLLSEDPWAIEAGLPIAQEDPELAAAWAELEEPIVQAPTTPAKPAAKPAAKDGKTPAAAPSNAKEPASPCKTKGGFCKEASSGCSGTFAGGLCPNGAATVKCCLSAAQFTAHTKEAAAACGPYAGKAGSPTQGNGGNFYNAVPIVKEHMSEPYKFGWDIKKADNTLEIKTACAFAKMHADAMKEGVKITIASGFRTLSRQQYFYDCMNTGLCNNGNLAAVPGSSNHGIGLAMDLNSEGKGVYKWLAKNGQKYGFVRTVPSEDWHWEYRVGWSRAPYT